MGSTLLCRGVPALLVLAGTVYGQTAPRITIANDDAHTPAEGSMGPSSGAMQDLLNWAVQHSDPDRLNELMQKYQDNNLTIKDVYGQDMIDALFVNEGSVMQDMVLQVSHYTNASITDQDLEGALERLEELVEQVDNAGNLHRMGGLKPLLDLGVAGPLLGEVRRSEPVRSLALWTLGVAVQNNPPVQADLVAIGGLPSLLQRLPVCAGTSPDPADVNDAPAGDEYCSKLLFALSGLVKNNQTIQASADALGLFDWLLDFGVSHRSASIAKKSLALLDIVFSQNANLNCLSSLPAKQDFLANSLLTRIQNTSQHDIDVMEKSRQLLNRLLSVRPMLFSAGFRSELSNSMTGAIKNCELAHAVGDELCEGLGDLAGRADSVLAARELPDDVL